MTSSALGEGGCPPSPVVERSNSHISSSLVISLTPLPPDWEEEHFVCSATSSSSSWLTSTSADAATRTLTRVFLCFLCSFGRDEAPPTEDVLHGSDDVKASNVFSRCGHSAHSSTSARASLDEHSSRASPDKKDIVLPHCASAAGSALIISSRVDLLLVYSLCLLFSLYTFLLLIAAVGTTSAPRMGNEGSALSSESSTPLSEYQSMYSLGSRVRSSVESTRAPSPMEPPEPDLSHLTEAEVAKIKEVMNRAKVMQEEEQFRARRLEEEYINFATKIEREASLTELCEEAGVRCPICSRNQIPPPARSPVQPRGPLLNVCVDCEKLTCQDCGALYTSAATKQQEWVCTVCERRRKLMMSTGMWYHGYHPDGELPLERKLTNPDTGSPLDVRPGGACSAMTLSSTSKDSRDSQDSRRSDFSSLSAEISLLTMTSSQNSELARQMYEQSKVKGPGAALPKSESDDFSDLASDLDFDEVASERSRPDGSSTEEIARDFCVISHPTQNAVPGGSQGNDRGQKGERRQKHRPKSLNLSRSHSHTSSDEDGEDDDSSGAGAGEHSGKQGGGREGAGGGDSGTGEGAKRKERRGVDRSSWKKDGTEFSRSHPPADHNGLGNLRQRPPPLTNPHSSAYGYGYPNHPPPVTHQHSHPPYAHTHQLSLAHGPLREANTIMPAELGEANKAVNSPTPPRSPSWREGLESPPFSPRRRDSYPGKKSRGSPVSPRDKKLHFTYNDLSPPHRTYSFDDVYDGQLGAGGVSDAMSFNQHAFSQRLSPKSPDESNEIFSGGVGQQMLFDLPATRGAKTGSSTLSSFAHGGANGAFCPPLVGQGLTLGGSASVYGGGEGVCLPHSAPVMDLATFAATVASNTASLTSMSVSPTTILPHGVTGLTSQHVEPQSPDSVDSTDSTSSPGSPGYYDNANSTSDDMEDVELADPTAKSIDMGSSKRQKARPPSTDWSPVIDLSPILDVSPSVEEAEQEDMLAKQLEELERQRSREESDMDRDDADMEEDEDEDVHMVSMSGSMSSSQDRSESFNPFALRPDHKIEDDSSDGLELTEFTSYSALRRYDKIEDISKIGDNSMDEDELIHAVATETADAAIAAALEEHRRQLMLNEDENGNPPSPSDDLPFPSCTSQAEATSTSGTGPTSVTASFSGLARSAGSGPLLEGQEQEARSQRRALEAHISDEISKITQGMQDIVRRGAADVKPIPPPKPRRRLPEPTPEMTAAAAAAAAAATVQTSGPLGSSYSMVPPMQFAPPPSKSPSMPAHRKRKTNGQTSKVKEDGKADDAALKQSPAGCSAKPPVDTRPESAIQPATSGSDVDANGVPRQDSAERRKAKDMKAKPSPLLIQHIEAEEQSVSPHYRVMDSPPTPENKLIKREFSESTSVSPSSSPDADHYMYPSPVTPPDSDSSPPKPHSPSSTGTDLDEDTLRYSSAGDLSVAGSGSGVSTISGGAQSLSGQANVEPSPDVLPREPYHEDGDSSHVKAFAKPVAPARGKNLGGAAPEESALPLKPPLPVRPKPGPRSADGVPPGEPEEGPSVRDKIRAFEQIASTPKEKKIEPKREVRRELPKKAPKPLPKDKDPATLYTSTTCSATTTSPPEISAAAKDAKKVRRKLPPIPVGEEPILASKSKAKRPKPPARKTEPSSRLSPPSAPPRSTSPLPRQPPPPPQRQLPQPVVPEQGRQLQQRQHEPPPPRKQPHQPQQLPRQPQLPPQLSPQLPRQPQLSPTLQQLPPPMPALHQPLLQSQRVAEEALNDEDMEVAQITTKVKDKRKMPLADLMKSKSIESSDPARSRDRGRPGGQEASGGGYSLQRAASVGSGASSFGSSSMDETDAIIDALINIYGIPITEAMKSLKRRLQEELRRVTRDRKRKLEELEEIRALQMQIGALKLEGDAYKLSRHGASAIGSSSDKRAPSYVNIAVEPKKTLTPRSSPQVTPRRQRHKRQSSDPMISKFSPIKEDKDIEADFQTKLADSYMMRGGGGSAGGGSMQSSRYSADDSSQSGLSDSESTRSEPVGSSTRYKKGQTSSYAKMYYPGRSGSSERLHPEHALLPGSGPPLSGSRSEQYLAAGYRSGSRTPTYYSDEEEKSREERKAQLQYEIQKRRQQLEETARLKKELLKLARARQAISHSYDDIPRQYGPPSHAGGGSVGNLNMSPRPVPRGIIRPIDDDIRMAELAERERERELERLERAYMERDDIDVIYDVLPARRGLQPPSDRDRPVAGERVAVPYPSRSNFSSTEYLVHKQQETARRQRPDEPLYVNTAPGWMYATDLMGMGMPEAHAVSQPVLTKRIDSLPSVAPGVPSRDGKLSSSVTLPDIHSNRCDLDFRPQHPVHASLSGSHTYVNTSVSDTDGSPTSVSDVTPAMPLLDDVKDKSRKIIHNIGSGSRPVSAEFNIGDVEDLMNGMYRVESDNSVDADEPIMKHMMEGGVTILKQMERKRRPPPVEPTRYNFPVKRILVTRDPKDRSVAGNGIGMKIVGGKEIPGTSETGAFVTAIYPGLIADQLHGELEVGDQVLEWNGIKLTGKTYEEVQQIITQTNGEIELVVRAQASSVTEETAVKLVESCHSSYDNLPAYEEVVKDLRATSTSRQGVDPRLLAAQLEEIQEAASPAEQSPSSSQQGPPTPSMSSPCSTPRSDPTSTSSDKQRPSGGRHTPDRRDRERAERRVGGGGAGGGAEKHHRRSTRHHRDGERERGERDRDGERGDRDRGEAGEQRDRDRGERDRSSSSARDRGTPPSRNRERGGADRDRDRQPRENGADRAATPTTTATTTTTSTTTTTTNNNNNNARQQERAYALPSDGSEESAQPLSSAATSTTSSLAAAAAQASSTTSSTSTTATATGADMQSNERRRNAAPASPELAPRSRTPSRKNKHAVTKDKASAPVPMRPEDKGLGAIQLQLSHDDYDNTLNVHVIQAVNLRPRDINGLSDPFVKVYLLPGRGPENKRRTKHIPRTLNPEWHQTLVFQDVARGELQNKVLELTVWDYDRFKANDFLGELVLELSEFGFLDNKPHWYPLREHVVIQSFELPKSSVPPPVTAATPDLKTKSKSPRHCKRHGGSATRVNESSGGSSGPDMGPRRRSMETLANPNPNTAGPAPRDQPGRQTASATTSPAPRRKPRDAKSPVKARSNGLLYRW